MEGSATVHMAAPADKIWELIADVRNTGRFSPEVIEAEWLGDTTGPALGAKFRGHVRRNVTESFRLNPAPWLGVYWLLGGFLRKRRNIRDMTKTLNRIKDVVEAG
jgi:hypothetical protein